MARTNVGARADGIIRAPGAAGSIFVLPVAVALGLDGDARPAIGARATRGDPVRRAAVRRA